MTEKELNPHALFGEFVRNYRQKIEPELKRGNLGRASVSIAQELLRFEIVHTSLPYFTRLKEGAYALYRIAVDHIGGLIDASRLQPVEGLRQEDINGALDCADRRVSELDLLMHNDEAYEFARIRRLDPKIQND